MATNQKRAELKSKVAAAEKRNHERQEQRTLGDYARERKVGERFGDFVIRAGYVAEVKEGRYFND